MGFHLSILSQFFFFLSCISSFVWEALSPRSHVLLAPPPPINPCPALPCSKHPEPRCSFMSLAMWSQPRPHMLSTCPWLMHSKPGHLSPSPIYHFQTAAPRACTHWPGPLAPTAGAGTAPGCTIEVSPTESRVQAQCYPWLHRPRSLQITPGSFSITLPAPLGTQLAQTPVPAEFPASLSSSASGQVRPHRQGPVTPVQGPEP